MNQNLIFSLSALFSLIPVTLVSFRREGGTDKIYWLLLAVAVSGPTAWAWAQIGDNWRTGLSTALWVTVALSLLIYALVAMVTRHGWRLTPLVMPVMGILGIFGAISLNAPEKPMFADAPTGWVGAHILVSVVTYALVTLGAISAVAAFLQERAIRTKQRTALTRLLPSVADCENLLVRLLSAGEVVLALGLITGMATQFIETGVLLVFDHKTVLSITAFVVIGALLIAHFRTGVRGRMAARLVLLAYLLLTLGYPGVKFVADIVLS